MTSHLFTCLFVILRIFIGEVSRSSVPLKVVLIELWVFNVLDTGPFIRYMVCSIFSLSVLCLLTPLSRCLKALFCFSISAWRMLSAVKSFTANTMPRQHMVMSESRSPTYREESLKPFVLLVIDILRSEALTEFTSSGHYWNQRGAGVAQQYAEGYRIRVSAKVTDNYEKHCYDTAENPCGRRLGNCR